jgi:hypothetical protein
MAKVAVWLCSFAAALAPVPCGAGEENVELDAVVSAWPTAPSTLREALQQDPLYPELESLYPDPELPRPNPLQAPLLRGSPAGSRLWAPFKAVVDSIRRWLRTEDDENIEDRRLQPGTNFPCRPARRPGEYGVILEINPERILECVSVTTEEVFHVNHRIVDITYGQFEALEVLMLSQRRGPSHYIEVIPSGDYAHYDVNRVPLKTFKDHSCLNRNMWCFVSQVKPIEAGFLVIDRHRVIHYNYTWLVEGSTAAADIPDVYINHFGQMNTQEPYVSDDEKLKFPTAVAEYMPDNETHVSANAPQLAGTVTIDTTLIEVTPLIPHAWCRLLFVTDTGNHRVVILNATFVGQFDYVGQFGITGEARDNSTGFNWPWGVAVSWPAWEARYEPVYANVFVVDRRNHRLVKLNLGYPLMPCDTLGNTPDQTNPLLYDEDEEQWMCRRMDKPRLSFSAEYGRSPDVYNRPKGLTDPTAVGIYRHFIVVAEVKGNAITLLRVDHLPPFGLVYVTYFKPVQGVYMQGGMSVSGFGYVWYNYIGTDMQNTFSSMYLPEILRESVPPNRFTEFLTECVNESEYQSVMEDPELYIERAALILNMSGINWEHPDRDNYTDLFVFNNSNNFDLDLLDAMVFNHTMVRCAPPTTQTPPPFFGGNEEGWVIDGQSQSEFAARAGVTPSSRIHFEVITSCLSVFLFLFS